MIDGNIQVLNQEDLADLSSRFRSHGPYGVGRASCSFGELDGVFGVLVSCDGENAFISMENDLTAFRSIDTNGQPYYGD